MAASDAQAWAGTILEMDPAGGGAYTTVAEVRDLRGPRITKKAINVTHSESDNDCDEFIFGTSNSGTVTFSLNFLPTSANQMKLLTHAQSDVGTTIPSWRISMSQFTPAKNWTFHGGVTSLEPSGDRDGEHLMDCEITVTGKATLA